MACFGTVSTQECLLSHTGPRKGACLLSLSTNCCYQFLQEIQMGHTDQGISIMESLSSHVATHIDIVLSYCSSRHWAWRSFENVEELDVLFQVCKLLTQTLSGLLWCVFVFQRRGFSVFGYSCSRFKLLHIQHYNYTTGKKINQGDFLHVLHTLW